MGNGSDERDERGRHSELNHDCVTRRRRATNIFKVMSSFEGSQYQLRHLESVVICIPMCTWSNINLSHVLAFFKTPLSDTPTINSLI
jgi:hypothetical protein